MEPHPKENDQEAVEDSGPKSSPSIGEKLKELLTAKPASYSEEEKPRRAEKEQMSGRFHPGEAVTEQKQGEVDGKRAAIGVSDERLMTAGGAAVDERIKGGIVAGECSRYPGWNN